MEKSRKGSGRTDMENCGALNMFYETLGDVVDQLKLNALIFIFFKFYVFFCLLLWGFCVGFFRCFFVFEGSFFVVILK